MRNLWKRVPTTFLKEAHEVDALKDRRLDLNEGPMLTMWSNRKTMQL